MKSKILIYFAIGSICVFLTAASHTASSGQVDSIVRLQQSTPGVQQIGGVNVSGTGLFGGNVGIAIGSSNSARLQVGSPTNVSSSTSAIQAVNSNSSGRGITGWSTGLADTYGVYGQVEGNGDGVYGLSNSATAPGFGVTGWSVHGSGIRGVGYTSGGEFDSNHGYGVDAAGISVGVSGFSSGAAGTGVQGYADGTGATIGGSFYAPSSDGVGVEGIGGFHGVSGHSTQYGGSGVTGSGGTQDVCFGVFGDANPTGWGAGGYFETHGTAQGFGVYGGSTASVGGGIGVCGVAYSPDGFGVYSSGNFGASGTKSFRIDHPLDPLNKYLNHYCSEGPEPLNIYSGTITTDAKGEAWVQLPDYFEAINKEPRYQLTVIDDSAGPGFVQVKVAKKIRNNRFMIMTSSPNIEVSWEVKAVRNDLWVRKYGAPVETEKSEYEKGKYQRPELYNASEEMGTDYRADRHRILGSPRPPRMPQPKLP